MRANHSRAVSTSCLDGRIATNAKAQKVDFNSWIFERIDISAGSKILELCSGTGAQAKYLAKMAGEGGYLLSCDASETSLEKLQQSVEELLCPVETLCCDMDELAAKLAEKKIGSNFFDVFFCSYGLYYSKDSEKLLDRVRQHMVPNGKMVVVGPHGSNNGPLFDLLLEAGVNLDDFVRHSSGTYMYSEVIPWGAACSERMSLYIMENEVHWNSAETFMTYWKNTIFFDESKESTVQGLVDVHFANHPIFINKKNVMACEIIVS